MQFELLDNILEVFSDSSNIESAHVRGSLARNDYDRASDVDLVIVVKPDFFVEVVESADVIMRENFGCLFEGWLDRIVPDFGGIGFVYLINREGTFHQIDLYFVPSHRRHKLNAAPRLKTIYESGPTTAQNNPERADQYIAELLATKATAHDIFVEIMILGFLIKKRILRRQDFLNVSETHLIYRAIRDLIRLTFDPAHREFGWYHLEQSIEGNEDAQLVLHSLPNHMKAHSFQTLPSLIALLNLAWNFVRDFHPSLSVSLRSNVEASLTSLNSGFKS